MKTNRVYAKDAWKKAQAKQKAHRAKVEELERKSLSKTNKRNTIATVVWMLAIAASIWAGRTLGRDPKSWLSKAMLYLIRSAKSFVGESHTQFTWGPLQFKTGWHKKQNGPMRPWVRISFNFHFPRREKGKYYKK